MSLRALRALKREAKSAFTFVSEGGAPFTVAGLGKLIERAGVAAKMSGAHTDPDAPLHLALAGQSIPLSSWRCRRVQLLATNKHASAVMPTLRPGGPDGG